jgi:hypothetical protein
VGGALGVVTSETTEFLVRLGGVEQGVGVTEPRFPNGGGWVHLPVLRLEGAVAAVA